MLRAIEPAPHATVFAPWVETQQERCRGGRILITAVNHRHGTAMHLDPADIDPGSGDLYDRTMIELDDGGFLSGPDDETTPSDALWHPAKSAGAGLVWRGADRFVRRWHKRGLYRAFDRAWITAQIGLALAGVIAFIVTLRSDGFRLHAHPAQIPAIIILGLAAVTIHELGHAVATVHFGRQVRMVGVRLHLGTPAFYVESIDALLLTRRQRLIQAAAGPWAEWLATSVAALVFLVLPHDVAGAAILHRFVIINTLGIAVNLLPFVGLDGALLLADIVHEPDLPFRAQRTLLAPDRRGSDRWLSAYAAANTVVAAALLFMAGFFWWQLFGSLGRQVWAYGPAGITVVVLAGAALGRQLVGMITNTFAPLASSATRIWTTALFRIERRWRVQAISAMRVLPEFAELDAAALGILAGRLRRVSSRGDAAAAVCGHVYVRRAKKRRDRHANVTWLARGAVAKLEDAQTDARELGKVLIVLPVGWQQFLSRPIAGLVMRA